MADEKVKAPTWAYRLHKSGEVESKLFDDVDDIPNGKGWLDSPAKATKPKDDAAEAERIADEAAAAAAAVTADAPA